MFITFVGRKQRLNWLSTLADDLQNYDSQLDSLLHKTVSKIHIVRFVFQIYFLLLLSATLKLFSTSQRLIFKL